MATIRLRSDKGSPLTIAEMDANFNNINIEVGTKLASSSYTAADVLTKVKTVDGTGSGLDADLLQGLMPKSTNTISSVVQRDTSGSFAANTITATSFIGPLTGNVIGTILGGVEGNVTGNVTGNLTGNVSGNINGTVGGITPTSASFTSVTLTNALTVNGSVGASGKYLQSRGAGQSPTWTTLDTTSSVFASGMIMLWSGTVATIPTGWLLCNGSNGTPDLRDKFVIGVSADVSGVAKTTVEGASGPTKSGGTKDAVVVSHTHGATSAVNDPGHSHTYHPPVGGHDFGGDNWTSGTESTSVSTTGITVATTVLSTGVSGTNQNLPPYYALAYIMKS